VKKFWLLWLAVGLAVPPSAASGAIPTAQTCKPANLPFTFVLPADWSCEGAPPYGNVMPDAKAGGMAPGFAVQLNIYAAKTRASEPVSRYASSLLAAIQKQFTHAPNLAISHVSTTVGASLSAVLITVSYRGASLQGAGTISHVDYFFIVGGYLYEFDYSGVKQWVTKEIRAIKASARSIHFAITA
jgi:hypothetical protein